MSKRVYELAKELGLSSRDVINALAALGVPAKSHSSTVDEDVVAKLKAAAEKGALKAGAAAPQRTVKKPTRPPLERPSAERAPVRRVPAAPQPQPAANAPSPPQPTAAQAPAQTVVEAPPAKTLAVHHGVTVQELAVKLGIDPADIVKQLFMLGEVVKVTQSLADEALELVAHEHGYQVQFVTPEEEEAEAAPADDDSPEDLAPRPPVITVMGHVDHGKTLLLDRVRETNVVAQEAGGITQHIGAYVVAKDGRPITFIDTPGHEAFTQMRARGAKATDIAVLVVAADDGVKPQTVEAISHARAANVPIVVAVNKIDKPEADPMKVRQQLTEHGLLPPEWGGDTEFVDISAKTGQNLDSLLQTLLIVADILELKANPKAPARGIVIEAHLDKGRGPVATVLVHRGTLRAGDAIVCGSAWARVRAMLDENGRPVREAAPGTPAQVLGFSMVPAAGDEFRVVEDERRAKHVAQERLAKQRAAEMVATKRLTLEELFEQVREGEVSELNIILKADVQGSLEAIEDSLRKIKVGDVRINVIHRAAGAITENDVTLAQASGAVVVGFNVRPDAKARDLAEREKVDVRTYQVIYKLVEDIEAALRGMLKPEFVEAILARVAVRATFKVPKIGVIAGCYVEEGTVRRGAKVRLLRDGVVVFDTTVSSLKRFKDDAREVQQGYECGIGLEGFHDIKEGDVLELYEVKEVPRA